jgi:hypothetical protein
VLVKSDRGRRLRVDGGDEGKALARGCVFRWVGVQVRSRLANMNLAEWRGAVDSHEQVRSKVANKTSMSKHDLQARPIYHRKRDSIEAHLSIVLAALAVSRWIEAQTGWPVRKFVKTARRYRTIQIQAGQHTITAADPLPDDLRQALDAINHPGGLAH